MKYINEKSVAVVMLFSCLLTVVAACAQPAAKQDTATYAYQKATPDGTGKWYMGREIAAVMGAAGAEWLERNSRNAEENTAAAIEQLPILSNSAVADIGAGTGYYAFRIAQVVPAGKVYAVEVQDNFVRYLNVRKKSLNAQNVEVVKGGTQSPNLPDSSIDLAIMVDVYHELEYPQEMLQALYKALRPNGKILLLEYRAEDPEIAIKPLHKLSVTQASKELEANGFKLAQQKNFLPIQHWLLYEKTN